MNWLELSFKEWQRRPLRTSITAAGVAIAVAALFSLLAFQRGYREGVRSELNRLGAHVLVVPKGCPYDAASMALHGAIWPCYLKQRYLAAVRTALGHDHPDPHRLLGMGGPEDVMVAGRLSVRDAVLERIELLGCRDKAVAQGAA